MLFLSLWDIPKLDKLYRNVIKIDMDGWINANKIIVNNGFPLIRSKYKKHLNLIKSNGKISDFLNRLNYVEKSSYPY